MLRVWVCEGWIRVADDLCRWKLGAGRVCSHEICGIRTIASISFSICAYCCCVGVSDLEAYAIGWSSWSKTAPMPLELASTEILVGLEGSKNLRVGWLVTMSFS